MQEMLRKAAIGCSVLAAAVLTGAGGHAADVKKDGVAVTLDAQANASPEDILAQIEGAEVKSKMPMLKSRSQLPETVRNLLEHSTGKMVPQAYGTDLWPFTTARALTYTTQANVPASVKKKDLARGVGRLFMHFSYGWYECTASVIDKGVLVTAAHCVQDYGEGSAGSADTVLFLPILDANETWWDKVTEEKLKKLTAPNPPYGVWKGRAWTVPSVYAEGTDTCMPEAEGIVCENDLAVIAVRPKSGVHVGTKVFPAADPAYKSYQHHSDDYSYTLLPLFAPDFKGAQIAQFGYPQDMDSGVRMIRTDSLGIQAEPASQVVIGSDQTGGSSGGPWFVNYGRPYISESSTPSDPEMGIMAVTSWGYEEDFLKIQGASRFAKNTAFPDKSNIDTLHEAVCAAFPTYCY